MITSLDSFLEERGLEESNISQVNESVRASIHPKAWVGEYQDGIIMGVHDSGEFPHVFEFPFPIKRFWDTLDAMLQGEENNDAK